MGGRTDERVASEWCAVGRWRALAAKALDDAALFSRVADKIAAKAAEKLCEREDAVGSAPLVPRKIG